MGATLDEIHSELKEVKLLLAGDKYGRKGMVQEQQEIKGMVYKNKEAIGRVKWLGGILTFAFGVATAIKLFFSSDG